MRHRNAFRKLGRTPSHRRALFRNLSTSLVLHGRIETTLPKAKELKRVAEKLVTIAKNDTLHTRRQAAAYLFTVNREVRGDKTKLTAVHKLFTEIAPRYKERFGGYTRVIRSGRRPGDKAEMAIIEFVEKEFQKKTKEKRKRRVLKSVAAAPEIQAGAVAAEEGKNAEAGSQDSAE